MTTIDVECFYSAPSINYGSQPPSSIIPSPSTPLAREDIRLCTINRADATDVWGIEFNYHRREQFHSLTIVCGRDDGPSISAEAGIKSGDRLIEINGQNIQNFDHHQVTQLIRAVKYPEPLQLLVADAATYDYYKREQKNIHRSLPTVRIMKPNRRQYRLQRDPDFEGYGFRVRSNHQADGTPHQIVSVEPYSPADSQGLRVGDYILRVNNQTVEHMNPTDFDRLMQNLVRNDNTRDGTLLLEVMDENTYRSLNQLPATDTLIVDCRTPSSPVSDSYKQSSVTDESYPRIRQCFIRPWPHYRELGFNIVPTPNSTAGGYQIEQLRLDSPAAHTHIRNGDHLIQVNNINVEATDFKYVYQLINDSYRRDGEVSLLVIDEIGYQWYRSNGFRIDPLSKRANVTRHVTPEHQA